MSGGATPKPSDPSQWQGRPIYGYDSPAVQNTYMRSEAASMADFFLPHLESGMSLLDCGCGPGALTLGLAEAVAPGLVVGIDLEPSMIERATQTAAERQIDNVRFRVTTICDLPFPGGSFDATFTSALLEHLSNPGQALQGMYRVLKPGGLIDIINTDWGEPLISPPDEAVKQFFELFEGGFNHHGGSLNRGRHLKTVMRQAGFTVTDFSASFNNFTTREAVGRSIAAYAGRIDHLPLFSEMTELGWIDRTTLDHIGAQMKRWSVQPDAVLALGRCKALGRKG